MTMLNEGQSKSVSDVIYERERQLMYALADCAGIFYEFNLTRNKIIGAPIKKHNGERIPLLQYLGLPSDCSFTDLVGYWGTKISQENYEEYRANTNLEYYKECYEQGKIKLNFKFRSQTEYGDPMLANRTTYLYKDINNGDILGFTYIKNEYELDAAKQKSLAAEEASYRDPLTHCFNRRRLEQVAKAHLEKPDAQASMMFIDLDGFKKFNDNFGHIRGDEVLVDEARSIESVFKGDEVVARLGGDEFIVFIPNLVDENKLIKQANLLKHRCFRIFTNADGVSVELSVSIGICRYPEFGKNYNELYACADVALYYSKKQGGNCFSFYRDLPAELKEDTSRDMNESVEFTMDNVDDDDYRALLNIFPSIGIYVISEKDHRLLFYNRVVQEAKPFVRLGDICHEAFAGYCQYCPIKKLGNKSYAYSTFEDKTLGHISVVVTRMLWHKKLPAIVVRVFPHMERGMKARMFGEG